MKKTFTLFAIIVLTISVFAQSPQKMSYQAVIRNSSDQLVTNHAIGMRISILQGSSTGTPVYVEIQNTITNANGLATIDIGDGTQVTGTFSGIDWSNGTYFIKTETDPTGGINYTITGVSQILSVPYALYSKTAKTADYNDLTNKPVLFDGNWTSLTGKPLFATVATSGNYNDLINKPTLFDGTWTNIIGKPTTLAGYGITNAMSTSHAANGITGTMMTNWNTAFGWGNHSGLYKPNSYVPAWVEITGKPTFAAVATSGNFSDLLAKPTTLAGYGITNAMSTSHAANGITSTMILNWNIAYGWGNHAGLYRPVAYVPAWSEITSKPTTVSGYGITDAVTITGNQTISGTKTFKGTTTNMEEALFEVKNKDGQTVFAVYNEGVRIYVSDGAKGKKGGFAVGGFGTDKAESTKYLFVDKDSIRMYLDTNPLTKGKKGGFAVGGYDLTKGTVQNYLDVNPDSIRAYIDHDITKGKKGGFAVGGFGTDKAESQKYLVVSKDSIRMYLDTNPLTKGKKGGFAVGGYDLTKGTTNDYMLIKPDSINFYVRELSPEVSSTYNIIGLKLNHARKSLMIARTDTLHISGVLNVRNNLIVAGNIDLSGTINTVYDIEGNTYKTVVIGTQVWMAENLKTTKYNDGTVIANVTDNSSWADLTTGAYCDYNNTPANSTTYGRLYNWYVVDNNAATKVASNGGKNVCPTGWHVPTEAEWTTMEDYLSYNGYNYDGTIGDSPNKISKSLASSTLWATSAVPGAVGNTDYPAFINKTGFTALPGGDRADDPSLFEMIGSIGYWWTSTDGGGGNAWAHGIPYFDSIVHYGNNPKNWAYSIRCLKD
jgi:uncharacterized protein (TIGR02145 family)